MMAAAVAFGCAATFAQEAKTNAEPVAEGAKAPVSESAEMLQVAGQLVKYGYENKEALPLIQAVEIYQKAGLGAMAEEKTTEGGEDAAKEEKVSFDSKKLLADAKEFAGSNLLYQGLIAQLESAPERGATTNYAVKHTYVVAHGTDTYTVRFRGGEQAIVVVSGDGDTDLDLYVYDENGNLVDSDTDNTDDCVCVWTPRWTGNFRIKVKNLGSVRNYYSMAVN